MYMGYSDVAAHQVVAWLDGDACSDTASTASIIGEAVPVASSRVDRITVEHSTCHIGSSVHVHGSLNVHCDKFPVGAVPAGAEDAAHGCWVLPWWHPGEAAGVQRGGALGSSPAALHQSDASDAPAATGPTAKPYSRPGPACPALSAQGGASACPGALKAKQLLLLPCVFLVAASIGLTLTFGAGPDAAPAANQSAAEQESATTPAHLPHGVEYVTRQQWGARANRGVIETLATPVDTVIVHHTGTLTCTSLKTCCERVSLMQQYNMDGRHWDDIGYNFLVGGDGRVYEGRGWDVVGDALGEPLRSWQRKALGVAVVGTFVAELPTAEQRQVLAGLLQLGVELGKIQALYRLVGACQLQTTKSPGRRFMRELRTWERWWDNGANWADMCEP